MTVTSAADAVAAAERGADVLVVQGLEAGGHRGGLTDDLADQRPLAELVPARPRGDVAAAGRHRRADDRRGRGGRTRPRARAESRSAPPSSTAPRPGRPPCTGRPCGPAGRPQLTRAFTGRTARGIVNRFLVEYADAPPAYPEVHFLTAPVRAAARAAGDGELVNLWAGTAYSLARHEPAADVVRRIGRSTRLTCWNSKARCCMVSGRGTLAA